MNRSFLFGGIIGTLLFCTVDFVDAWGMGDWKVIGGGGGIREGVSYSLYNLDQGLYLEEKDRSGANLGWTSGPNGFMRVKRLSPGSGSIKCGEPFALFIEKEWVIYDKQSTGINLSTRTQVASSDPYKWVFAACTPGSTILANTNVTLSNIAGYDLLVGCKRVWGVNLCWARDVTTVAGKNYRTNDFPKLHYAIMLGQMVVGRGVESPPEGEPIGQQETLPPPDELTKWQQEKLEELLTLQEPPTLEGNSTQVADKVPPAEAGDPKAPPSVSLTQTVHFTDTNGQDVTVVPGKYRIEATGKSGLKLTPTDGKEPIVIE